MTKTYRKGVGAVIVNDQNLIFVANRIDAPSSWQLPQGGIDDNESEKDAILRELLEEIGTNDVEILRQTKDWLRYDLPEDLREKMASYWGKNCVGQEQIWYLCKTKDTFAIDLKTQHPEFLGYQWVNPQFVLENIIEFKKDLYLKILKEFDFL